MYQHIGIANLFCEITEETSKGYKVKQWETGTRKKPKPITQYYYSMDFHGAKAIWKEVKE